MHNIPVIYEDEWLLIVDKPPGLVTIPTPRKETRTLTSILNQHAQDSRLSYRFHPCHRLDRDTSGLMVYAKGKAVQKKMMLEFKERKVSKGYIAFVHGIPAEEKGRIEEPIEGQPAQTIFRRIDTGRDFSVLEVAPLTGRKNQIRIHLALIGHPIVGEDKFIFRRDYSLRAKRICLHAKSLEFIHPVSAKPLKVVCELEKDLLDFLAKH